MNRTKDKITPAANSTYPKVEVRWLNQTFCLVNSKALRNRHIANLKNLNPQKKPGLSTRLSHNNS